MYSPKLLHVVFAFLLLAVVQVTSAKAPGITYSGGDGTSIEKAILIKGATEQTGVNAEYEYIEKHFPRSKRGGQSLQNVKGRTYDVLDFTTADGAKKILYFDITEFFGKF